MNGPGKFTGGCPGEFCGFSYEGGFKDGTFNGQGELVNTDGTIFTGLFKEGKWVEDSLIIKKTYADGSKYVGGGKDGEKNGQGTYTYASGDKYVGEWKDDKREGQGTLTFNCPGEFCGIIVEGEWEDGDCDIESDSPKCISKIKCNNPEIKNGTIKNDEGIYQGEYTCDNIFQMNLNNHLEIEMQFPFLFQIRKVNYNPSDSLHL